MAVQVTEKISCLRGFLFVGGAGDERPGGRGSQRALEKATCPFPRKPLFPSGFLTIKHNILLTNSFNVLHIINKIVLVKKRRYKMDMYFIIIASLLIAPVSQNR